MSASDSEMQEAAEDSLLENLGNAVTEYQIGRKRVRRDPMMVREQLNAMLTMRALQSPRRGLSLGKVDKPA
jgi:hypothetical protein